MTENKEKFFRYVDDRILDLYELANLFEADEEMEWAIGLIIDEILLLEDAKRSYGKKECLEI